MIPALADLDQTTFLPSRLAPIVQRLLQEPATSLNLVALRSLYFYLQDELDHFIAADSSSSDSHDGDDGDPTPTAPSDNRDGDDGNQLGLRTIGGQDYAFLLDPSLDFDLDPGPDLVIDDALLHRVYHHRFYFTATDLLVHFRADCLVTGRDDLSAGLTPSSIGHELKRLGLPFRRTGRRRLYSLNFPFLIWLLDLYRTYQLVNAAYLAATPAPHPLEAFTL